MSLPGNRVRRGLLSALALFGLLCGTATAEDRILRIVSQKNHPPYAFIDADGEPRGVWIDLWRTWSESTGIDIQYRLLDGSAVRSAVLEGNADLIGGSPALAAEEGVFRTSEPFMEAPVYSFRSIHVENTDALETLAAFRVGVIENGPVADFLQKQYPHIPLAEYPDMDRIIQGMLSEEIRVFVANAHTALFHLGRSGMGREFRQGGRKLFSIGICAAAPAARTDLIHTVNAGFSKIPKSRKSAVIRDWTGLTLGHRIPWQLISLGTLLIISIGCVLIFWLWNDQLRKKIDTATADLKEKQRQLIEYESKLRQAQKMEAIGTLAGGIAHDFNNILTAMIGYTEIARLHISGNGRAADSLGKILNAGERAKDLVGRILSFCRQSEREMRPTPIVPLVEEVLHLLRASLPTTIRIEAHIGAEAWRVNADPIQIHQMLMNLCTNAKQAMQTGGGALTIKMEPETLASFSAPGFPELSPGRYLHLSVSDTGCGIPPEMMDRIFDPYFTTKGKGEGTGLGLSMVHGIIARHAGSIRVESTPGEGTRFSIYLPLTEEEPTAAAEEKTGTSAFGSEHILVVDDEPFLVDIAREMLTQVGYRVTACTDSGEALNRFKGGPHTFDMVITDMTMPKMTGMDLAAEILKIRPDIPIILCTGYSESITPEAAGRMGIQDFFFKPYDYQDLIQTIRKRFDGR